MLLAACGVLLKLTTRHLTALHTKRQLQGCCWPDKECWMGTILLLGMISYTKGGLTFISRASKTATPRVVHPAVVTSKAPVAAGTVCRSGNRAAPSDMPLRSISVAYK